MIYFNFEEKEWRGLTVPYIKELEKAYPDVNVVRELQYRMPLWILNSGKKGKKKNWPRFINNWLSRQQSRIEETRILRNG